MLSSFLAFIEKTETFVVRILLLVLLLNVATRIVAMELHWLFNWLNWFD